MSPRAAKPTFALLCVALLALAIAACGNTVSTSSFKGESHEVAQAIADLQSDATAGDQKKLCANDLAATVLSGLGGKKGCERTLKTQLAEIDNLEANVKSIQIAPGAKTATATVKSTYAGKSRTASVSLVKEGGAWKVSAVH
jgi:copper chaperone CopZ